MSQASQGKPRAHDFKFASKEPYEQKKGARKKLIKGGEYFPSLSLFQFIFFQSF